MENATSATSTAPSSRRRKRSANMSRPEVFASGASVFKSENGIEVETNSKSQSLDLLSNDNFIETSRKLTICSLWQQLKGRFTSFYSRHISFYIESSIITAFSSLAILSGFLLYYLNGITIVNAYSANFLEIALVLVAYVAVLISQRLNFLHAKVRLIRLIITGKATLDTIIKSSGSQRSTILWVATGLYSVIILALYSSITNTPIFSIDGLGIFAQLTWPLVPAVYQTSIPDLITIGLGSTYTCNGCEGIDTGTSLLVPMSANLVSTSKTSGYVIMQVKQDLLSLNVTCITIPSSDKPSIIEVNSTALLSPTSTSASFSLTLTSIDSAALNYVSRKCMVTSNDFSGFTHTIYKVQTLESYTRYTSIDSIQSLPSNCTTTGSYCLSPSSKNNFGFQLLSPLFSNTLLINQDYASLGFFPNPALSISDAAYALKLRSWLALLLRMSTINYQTTLASCPILYNSNTVSIAINPILGMLLVAVASATTIIGFIILGQDLVYIRNIPDKLLRRLEKNTTSSREMFEDFWEHVGRVETGAINRMAYISYGEDAVGKRIYGAEDVLLPVSGRWRK